MWLLLEFKFIGNIPNGEKSGSKNGEKEEWRLQFS